MSAEPAFDLFADIDYPEHPGWKARETAITAANEVAHKAPRLRQMCLDQLTFSGPLTADECAARLGLDKLSIRPRFSELVAKGHIADTGERRLNSSQKRAIVWSLARRAP
jgi:predicted ArsR family transcriptional regulator